MIENLNEQKPEYIDGLLCSVLISSSAATYGQLLDTSLLYSYAFPFGYHRLYFKLVYVTDFCNAEEISDMWSEIILSLHDLAAFDSLTTVFHGIMECKWMANDETYLLEKWH